MALLNRRMLGVRASHIVLGIGASMVIRPAAAEASSSYAPREPTVKTGFEKLKATEYAALRGHKVGIIANVASVDNQLRSVVDCLYQEKTVHLQAIFGPEHGFRGSMREGFSEPQMQDPQTGCTVYDIYAKTGDALRDILKKSEITCLVFDVQDTGSRFYTYIWTLFDCMVACAQLGLPLYVLDRPNPITGAQPSGPVLDPTLASFVGRAPIALRHGMTVGELAGLFNAAFIPTQAGKSVALTVEPMDGWQRSMFFEETGLTWCPPSPNMPSPLTALVYPGTCLFEGTQFSVGRGTTMPFQYLGSAVVDGRLWAEQTAALNCPGAAFRDVWFTPLADPFKSTLLHGLHCAVANPTVFDPITTGMALLSTGRKLAGKTFWRGTGKEFDRLCGTHQVRTLLDKGATLEDLTASWQTDLARFGSLRQAHLLY